jgi:type IV secretory pathway TrbL component
MINEQFSFFIFHIIISLFLSYLAYMIINYKKIPNSIGYILFGTSIFIISVHVYMYFFKKNDTDSGKKLRGLNFDTKDKKYDIIGGVGGLGWG